MGKLDINMDEFGYYAQGIEKARKHSLVWEYKVSVLDELMRGEYIIDAVNIALKEWDL